MSSFSRGIGPSCFNGHGAKHLMWWNRRESMTERRKRHTREFKVQAVELLNASRKPGYLIEEEPGIGRGVIYRWRR